MGINAMENEVYQPQDTNPLGKLFNVVLVFIVGFALLFGVAYGVKWAYNWYYAQPSVAAFVEKATSKTESVHFQQYCDEVKCVQVKMCTAISDECGDMTQGPKADYGTGFNMRGEGTTVLSSGVVYQNRRMRPNPPAGWKWAGK